MMNASEIRRRRLALNLTMAQAAKLAGLSHFQTWNGYESGARTSASLATVIGIAKALGCKVDDLLSAPGAAPKRRTRARPCASVRRKPSKPKRKNAR